MRDCQSFNDALLAKIGWRLLNNPNCLLGKLLKGKYFADCSILQATEASVMSHGWRSILIGRDLLLKNMGWTVGDGVSINIWQDPWLCLNKQERPMGLPSEQSVDLCVADLLVDGGKHWDRQKLQLLLPAYEEKILCIKPSLTGSQDKLICLGTKGGESSVKSGYYVAVEEEPDTRRNDAGFNWKRNVWALDCAPKVKLFAWKLLKGAIPVGERLLERHIEVDPRCKKCGNNESITHLLFQCQFAQKVWQLAPLLPGMDSSGMLDLMVVWPSICNQKSLLPAGIVNGSVVPWVMWSLWKARNRLVFEGFSASPEDTLSTAIRMAREWSLQSKPEKPDTSRSRKPEMIAPTGTRIVRSDAAWSASSLTAGAGWVILSSPQNMTFQQHLEFVASPLMAEGLALREAVLTCQRLKLQHIRFESDSAQLIKCLPSNETIAELHSVVFDILKLSEFFDSVSFVWLPRERNVEADALAKGDLALFEPLVVGEIVNAPN